MNKIINLIRNILVMFNIAIIIFIIGMMHFNNEIYASTDKITYNDMIEKCKATYKIDETSKEYNVKEYISQSITSIKNQGKSSLCWSYAAISTIEANMIKCNNFSKRLDLSEIELATNSHYLTNSKISIKLKDNEDFITSGGTYSSVVNVLALGTPLVTENNKIINEYHLNECFYYPMSNINAVKKAIYTYGAIATSAYIEDDYFSDNDISYYQNKEKFSNHSISIIGWSDNYSKNNFKIKPKNNGAWLVKNSWGINRHNNGLFWISYEDLCLINKDAITFSFNKIDKKNKRYQYDYSPSTNYVKAHIQAAIFNTSTYDETINNIMFKTENENIMYKIYIYKNINKNAVDGELITEQHGILKEKGIHTINIQKNISLKPYTKFSVVIEMCTEKGNEVKIPISCNINSFDWLDIEYKPNIGETFVGNSSNALFDTCTTYDGSCRIKVNTVTK